MSAAKLKPCPFCGGEPDADIGKVTQFRIASDGTVWAEIRCSSCQARMEETVLDAASGTEPDYVRAFKHGKSWIFTEFDLERVRQAAVQAWNRRVSEGGSK